MSRDEGHIRRTLWHLNACCVAGDASAASAGLSLSLGHSVAITACPPPAADLCTQLSVGSSTYRFIVHCNPGCNSGGTIQSCGGTSDTCGMCQRASMFRQGSALNGTCIRGVAGLGTAADVAVRCYVQPQQGFVPGTGIKPAIGFSALTLPSRFTNIGDILALRCNANVRLYDGFTAQTCGDPAHPPLVTYAAPGQSSCTYLQQIQATVAFTCNSACTGGTMTFCGGDIPGCAGQTCGGIVKPVPMPTFSNGQCFQGFDVSGERRIGTITCSRPVFSIGQIAALQGQGP